jgi:gamma-glutamylcyclotransferase (GGCT)/AIG2-like uncharacterized protein YtfP
LSKPVNIFVYGTLKERYGNHGVLGNSVFLGEGVTVDKHFTMFDGGFPFVSDAFDDGNQGCVIGEIYQTADKDILANLDRLEGVPYLYVKREIDVTNLDGVTFQATIYVASEGSNNRLKTKAPMKPKGRARLLEWK